MPVPLARWAADRRDARRSASLTANSSWRTARRPGPHCDDAVHAGRCRRACRRTKVLQRAFRLFFSAGRIAPSHHGLSCPGRRNVPALSSISLLRLSSARDRSAGGRLRDLLLEEINSRPATSIRSGRGSTAMYHLYTVGVGRAVGDFDRLESISPLLKSLASESVECGTRA